MNELGGLRLKDTVMVIVASDPDTIEIVDESTADQERHQLYIDGQRRGFVKRANGKVTMHWEVYGPQGWPDAKVLMSGLLQLSVIADQLSGVRDAEEPKKRRRSVL